MRNKILILGILLACFAQQADAQVIILPTGQATSVGTTVDVPDGGFVLLGNVHYGAEGMIQRGLPGLIPIVGVGPLLNHRAFVSQKGETQIYIGVRIHDFEELDRQTFLKGLQIIQAKRAAGFLPPEEKPLPNRLPTDLKQSFASER